MLYTCTRNQPAQIDPVAAQREIPVLVCDNEVELFVIQQLCFNRLDVSDVLLVWHLEDVVSDLGNHMKGHVQWIPSF